MTPSFFYKEFNFKGVLLLLVASCQCPVRHFPMSKGILLSSYNHSTASEQNVTLPGFGCRIIYFSSTIAEVIHYFQCRYSQYELGSMVTGSHHLDFIAWISFMGFSFSTPQQTLYVSQCLLTLVHHKEMMTTGGKEKKAEGGRLTVSMGQWVAA